MNSIIYDCITPGPINQCLPVISQQLNRHLFNWPIGCLISLGTFASITPILVLICPILCHSPRYLHCKLKAHTVPGTSSWLPTSATVRCLRKILRSRNSSSALHLKPIPCLAYPHGCRRLPQSSAPVRTPPFRRPVPHYAPDIQH